MECRVFEITIISAHNLEDYPRMCRMRVYARVSIGGLLDSGKRTRTDRHGDENPAWNCTMKYNLYESMVQHYNTMLVVQLFRRRRFACDRYVGEVHIPLKVLFDNATSTDGSAIMSLPIQKGSVCSKGALKFSYRFGESVPIEKKLLAESVAAGWNQC